MKCFMVLEKKYLEKKGEALFKTAEIAVIYAENRKHAWREVCKCVDNLYHDRLIMERMSGSFFPLGKSNPMPMLACEGTRTIWLIFKQPPAERKVFIMLEIK